MNSVRIDYAIRLNSGKLGGPAAISGPDSPIVERGLLIFYLSADEGKTWEKRAKIQVGKVPGWPYANTLIQTQSGLSGLGTLPCTASSHAPCPRGHDHRCRERESRSDNTAGYILHIKTADLQEIRFE